MRIGIAADHGGFELKVQITAALRATGYEVVDFGAYELVIEDDYPDFVVPLAREVAKGEVTRGLAICNSGVGACVAANKLPGVRAALIVDSFSAHPLLQAGQSSSNTQGIGRRSIQKISPQLKKKKSSVL